MLSQEAQTNSSPNSSTKPQQTNSLKSIQQIQPASINFQSYTQGKKINLHEKTLQTMYEKLYEHLFDDNEQNQEIVRLLEKLIHQIWMYKRQIKIAIADNEHYLKNQKQIEIKIKRSYREIRQYRAAVQDPIIFKNRKKTMQQLSTKLQNAPAYQPIATEFQEISDKISQLQHWYSHQMEELDRKMNCINIAIEAVQLFNTPFSKSQSH